MKGANKKAKVDVVVGLQYGCEGKNRVVEVLADKYDVITPVGCMPSHTHSSSDMPELNTLPTCAYTHKGTVMIGNGAYISPVTLQADMANIRKANPDEDLIISLKASLVLPTHELLESAYTEYKKDAGNPGLCEAGAYAAAADAGAGMRLCVADVFRDDFSSKYNAALNRHLSTIAVYQPEFNPMPIMDDIRDKTGKYIMAINWMKEQQVGSVEYLMNSVIESNGKVLAIMSNGAMQDKDLCHPRYTYPSTTTAAAAASNMGVSPSNIRDVIGVFKAYTTLYTDVPFPGEIIGKDLKMIQAMGYEYRCNQLGDRCGWIDLVQLKYACMVNGVTKLAITKLDVLCGLKTLKLVTAYIDQDGDAVTQMPFDLDGSYKPKYVEMGGWREFIPANCEYEQLPVEARNYISFIENYLGMNVSYIAYGPDKEQTIIK